MFSLLFSIYFLWYKLGEFANTSRHLIFKPQYQHACSPYCSPYISYGTSWENLPTHQDTSSLSPNINMHVLLTVLHIYFLWYKLGEFAYTPSRHLIFKPQYQHACSPYCSPYISYGTSWENLPTHQDTSSLSPNINMHVLLTVLHIFLMVQAGRICLHIKTSYL